MTGRDGDRRLPRGERRIGERLAGHGQYSTADVIAAGRRTDVLHVWAVGYLTIGTRGRPAMTMIVPACVFCGCAHRHNGKPEFTVGKRTASCHQGRYLVHLGTLEGRVAA